MPADGGLLRSWRTRLNRRRSDVASAAPFPATFRDPALESAFRDDGYVIVDLLDAAATAELLTVCERIHPERVTTWASDFYSTSTEVKEEVASAIRSAFAGPLERLLVGHAPVMTNFVVNWPGPDGGLELHQHSSLVDERGHRSVVIWCALNDADEANGTLHVVPRSHHVPRGPWGERSPNWFGEHLGTLFERHLSSVSVAAGSALIIDNALLHCSFANVTEDPRRTAVAVISPTATDLRYYEWVDETHVHAFRLTPEFFLRSTSAGFEMSRPDGLELIGVEEVEPTAPTADELAAVLGAGDCSHAL